MITQDGLELRVERHVPRLPERDRLVSDALIDLVDAALPDGQPVEAGTR